MLDGGQIGSQRTTSSGEMSLVSLCKQEDETIAHILASCVFSRTVWSLLFRRYRLPDVSPSPDDKDFFDCWMRVVALSPEQVKQGLNLVITLGAWMLWKHHNNCVFNGANTNTQLVIRTFLEEAHLWCFVGTKGLAHLEVVARWLDFVQVWSCVFCNGRECNQAFFLWMWMRVWCCCLCSVLSFLLLNAMIHISPTYWRKKNTISCINRHYRIEHLESMHKRVKPNG